VQVKSTLVFGTTPGTSDLIVDIEPGQRIRQRRCGQRRATAATASTVYGTINLNNPLGLGDVELSRRDFGQGAWNYGRAVTRCALARLQQAWRASRPNYELGGGIRYPSATGKAEVASVLAAIP
jgi:hypothetical protein